MIQPAEFGPEALAIDPAAVSDQIAERLQGYLRRSRRRGAVVALSGGIDSSVTAALCVRALGSERVFGLHLPEQASSPDSLMLSQHLADHYGFASTVEDISPILTAAGCYRRYDDAVREVVPEYGAGWRSKLVLPGLVDSDRLRLHSLVVADPAGQQSRHRLKLQTYLGIVAATNFKQRVRKMLEYYHADRLNYITTGTPNRLEYDQGFFVKLGDGAADFKPIAHLYKSQVYALAGYLDVPAQIRNRPPTTDTYSLEQSQEEFYFSLPHQQLDLCLYGKNHQLPPAAVAQAAGLTPIQVERVFADIEQKRRTTGYLHLAAELVTPVPEVGPEPG